MNNEKETNIWFQLCQCRKELHVLETDYESEMRRLYFLKIEAKRMRAKILILVVINIVVWIFYYLIYIQQGSFLNEAWIRKYKWKIAFMALTSLIYIVREYLMGSKNKYIVQIASYINIKSIAVQRKECTANTLKLKDELSYKKKQMEALKIEVKEKHNGENEW